MGGRRGEFAWDEGGLVASKVAAMLDARGLGGKRIGMEMDRGGPVPELVAELGRILPNMSIVDASNVVTRVKKIKSMEEIEYMREAGGCRWRGPTPPFKRSGQGSRTTSWHWLDIRR